MKALLIAEDEQTINALVPAIKSAGAEVIVYRWLLKALDNVEEIAPDAVIISTAEYPRHWKTFAQFTKSGFGGKVPKTILYNSKPMGNDEKEKARSLGVFGMFSSLDKDGLEDLKNYLIGKKGGTQDFLDDGKKYEFVFTNPKSKCLVTGVTRKLGQDKIEFACDVGAFVKNLQAGDVIQNATFGEDKSYKHVCAKVLSNDKVLELRLT